MKMGLAEKVTKQLPYRPSDELATTIPDSIHPFAVEQRGTTRGPAPRWGFDHEFATLRVRDVSDKRNDHAVQIHCTIQRDTGNKTFYETFTFLLSPAQAAALMTELAKACAR
jgi:hypothetical protein